MTGKKFEHQEIKETQNVLDLMPDATISSLQADYPLREVEFEWIKHGKSSAYIWAHGIALTTFGFVLNLGAKNYFNIFLISKYEWYAIAFGIGAPAVLYFIGKYCLSNKRKKVMKEIEKHFENAPVHKKITGKLE